MDGDEQLAARAVGDPAALAELLEAVVAARVHDAEAELALDHRPERAHDAQRHVLLADAVVGRPDVVAAVAGVEHDGVQPPVVAVGDVDRRRLGRVRHDDRRGRLPRRGDRRFAGGRGVGRGRYRVGGRPRAAGRRPPRRGSSGRIGAGHLDARCLGGRAGVGGAAPAGRAPRRRRPGGDRCRRACGSRRTRGGEREQDVGRPGVLRRDRWRASGRVERQRDAVARALDAVIADGRRGAATVQCRPHVGPDEDEADRPAGDLDGERLDAGRRADADRQPAALRLERDGLHGRRTCGGRRRAGALGTGNAGVGCSRSSGENGQERCERRAGDNGHSKGRGAAGRRGTPRRVKIVPERRRYTGSGPAGFAGLRGRVNSPPVWSTRRSRPTARAVDSARAATPRRRGRGGGARRWPRAARRGRRSARGGRRARPARGRPPRGGSPA